MRIRFAAVNLRCGPGFHINAEAQYAAGPDTGHGLVNAALMHAPKRKILLRIFTRTNARRFLRRGASVSKFRVMPDHATLRGAAAAIIGMQIIIWSLTIRAGNLPPRMPAICHLHRLPRHCCECAITGQSNPWPPAWKTTLNMKIALKA